MKRSNRLVILVGVLLAVGIIVTMIIGIVGAFIGGFLGNTIMGLGINGFTWQSLLLAIVGALVLLWIYRLTTRGRTRVP